MFDLDVAIKVCRNASIEHALALAERNQKHDLCLSIFIEDKHAFIDAIRYIQKLPIEYAEENIRKYGIALMEQCPNETTEILKRLCTENANKTEYSTHEDKVKDFINVFVKAPDCLIDFLEHLVTKINDLSPLVYNTLIELYLHRWKQDEKATKRLSDILKNNMLSYDRNHALILCRMYDFWPGILHIYEEQKL